MSGLLALLRRRAASASACASNKGAVQQKHHRRRKRRLNRLRPSADASSATIANDNDAASSLNDAARTGCSLPAQEGPLRHATEQSCHDVSVDMLINGALVTVHQPAYEQQHSGDDEQDGAGGWTVARRRKSSRMSSDAHLPKRQQQEQQAQHDQQLRRRPRQNRSSRRLRYYSEVNETSTPPRVPVWQLAAREKETREQYRDHRSFQPPRPRCATESSAARHLCRGSDSRLSMNHDNWDTLRHPVPRSTPFQPQHQTVPPSYDLVHLTLPNSVESGAEESTGSTHATSQDHGHQPADPPSTTRKEALRPEHTLVPCVSSKKGTSTSPRWCDITDDTSSSSSEDEPVSFRH